MDSSIRSNSLQSQVLGLCHVLEEVLSHLSKADLFSCRQVSTTFHRMADALLLRCIELPSNIKHFDGLIRLRALAAPLEQVETRKLRQPRAVVIKVHVPDDCLYFPANWDFSLCTAHFWGQLKDWDPLDDVKDTLPNVKTVIFKSYDVPLRHGYWANKVLEWHECEFRFLKPKRSVFIVDKKWPIQIGQSDVTAFGAEEVVLHFPKADPRWFDLNLNNPYQLARPLRKERDETRLFTFVLLPTCWENAVGDVNAQHDDWLTVRQEIRDFLPRFIAQRFIDDLDAGHPVVKVRMVGLDEVDPFLISKPDEYDHWGNRHHRALVIEREVRQKLQNYLVHEGGIDPIAAEELQGKVTFETFVEYLEGCSWREELPWQLVGRWLNASDKRELDELAG